MRPGLRELAAVFGRIGVVTFGSGNTATALIGHVLEARGWLPHRLFNLSFAVARLTPGTNLLAFCTGAGWLMRGWAGALTALLVVAVPTSIVAVLLTIAIQTSQTHSLGKAAVGGAMAAIIGIIPAGAWLLVRGSLYKGNTLRVFTLFTGALLLSAVVSLSPLKIILIAAAAGALWPGEKQ